MKEKRLDIFLVEKGLCTSRSAAQNLIKSGQVLVNDKQVSKTSYPISESDNVIITKENIFVGRGADKLISVLNQNILDFTDKIVADVGASTGGFTEVALSKGAKKVYAIDVGHDQLASVLKDDNRVINMEGINVKFPFELEEKIDIILVDLSFISLTKVLENVLAHLGPLGKALVLVKPQFETSKKEKNKKGVVKDSHITKEVIHDLYKYLQEIGFSVLGLYASELKGKKGNQEYFFHICPKEQRVGLKWEEIEVEI
ncbi:MAG: TlyA family RNA methyltransferase [Bdellovibrionales bacterium]|nr:TlyA family RNA methyltransferase [Bdellovibrionales bacterium]